MRIVLAILWRLLAPYRTLLVLYVVTTAGLMAAWVADPLLGQSVIDSVMGVETTTVDSEQFLPLMIAWIVVSIALCALNALHKLICWRMMSRVYVGFMQLAYRRSLHMDVAQHINRRAGAVIKRIDNAAETLWDVGFQMTEVMAPSFLTAIVFVILAFRTNAILASFVTGAIAIYGIATWLVMRNAAPLQKTVSRVWVSVVGRAYDIATNILVVKSSGAEEREMRWMQGWHERAFRLQRKADNRWAVLEGINMFVILRITIIGLGLWLSSRNLLTLGELFFFLFIVFRLLTPVEVLAAFLPKWNEKLEKIRMGLQITELPSVVQSMENGRTLEPLRGELTFDAVNFRYDRNAVRDLLLEDLDEEVRLLDPHAPDAIVPHAPPQMPTPSSEKGEPPLDHDTIQDFTLTIRAGEHVALVGHSGAGKSTLAALINRFYDVTGGRLLVDGTDVRELDLHWWRKQIGLVLQDNTMFNETILDNIRYARPDATNAEVIEAAQRASAHDFISALPQGYNTMVGERGIRLSGGERQRVAIARAILKNPTIVVLDEATSALDSVTEARVQEGIRELIANRTAVIIAHRLSTVRSVDRIAVLEAGRLVACAPHEELLKTCPVYREMVELQSHGMLAE